MLYIRFILCAFRVTCLSFHCKSTWLLFMGVRFHFVHLSKKKKLKWQSTPKKLHIRFIPLINNEQLALYLDFDWSCFGKKKLRKYINIHVHFVCVYKPNVHMHAMKTKNRNTNTHNVKWINADCAYAVKDKHVTTSKEFAKNRKKLQPFNGTSLIAISTETFVHRTLQLIKWYA